MIYFLFPELCADKKNKTKKKHTFPMDLIQNLSIKVDHICPRSTYK